MSDTAYEPIQIGDAIRHGIWCDDCCLPSVMEFPIFVLRASGVKRIGTIYPCENCMPIPEEEEAA